MDTKKWFLENLPVELRKEINKCAWEQNTVGMSGAYTYRLTDAKKQNRYLKIMPKVLNNSLKRETEIMKWLE
ncbi:hypothetical protein DFR55_14814 [Herbinix hemicellulosilytica]|uniref:Uncharacterized protein n=1 Tax=Herbinix hemicellulosilytica TaxID=1564487 RepID=A0A0H5SKZ3_HERHM|nr:hypothetical protein [Herbinix hemicellulosilytica]RBP56418.1 hypothetical protein DFR55_14814 [Herbinix hemicellulosilytica]CRZ35441.1 hypothetical protein HHT355_2250 [Herbinix hemicellulosilytica]